VKKKSVTIIVAMFTIALLGLLYSQWLWINKSYKLKEEQLDHRVDMALNDVIDEFKRYKDTSLNAKIIIDEESIIEEPKTILDIVQPEILDTLLAKYFLYHHIELDYGYAIVKSGCDSVIYKSTLYKGTEKGESYKACLSCLWQKEIFHLDVVLPGKSQFILMGFGSWILLSMFFVLIVGASFWYTVHTFLKQKKISEMKNDFINNMTHEFKTPISTIQLTGEVLQKKLADSADNNIKKYLEIILNENLRMRAQVERILQMAVLDKGGFNLKKAEFDIHELIQSTVDNLCLDFCEKSTNVDYHMEATNHDIKADKVHITNVIVNLVQNSIKYSNGLPEIKISTFNENGSLVMSVEDKGIGMGPDKIKHIFDKFYRIPMGNIHDVKGFGLGLFYVKTMVEAHGGNVRASSQLNKGSRFDVILPIKT